MELITKFKQAKFTTNDLKLLNNTIIVLMVLVAASSICWTISIYILSGDFSRGFIGAKLEFRERNFQQMTSRSKTIFYNDLWKVLNNSYHADEIVFNDVISSEQSHSPTIKPNLQNSQRLINSTTIAPEANQRVNDEDQLQELTTSQSAITDDRLYLATMQIDIYHTLWRENATIQFMHNLPFLSEIIAIIWTAMCLVFQSASNKNRGLPKPWRIVAPSLIVFTIMTGACLVYSILVCDYLKSFCHDIKSGLRDPSAISCGQAISVLRPVIRQHELPHQVYLILFQLSFILTLILWILALIVMIMRFTFAIDFQLVDIYLHPTDESPEFTEVNLNSPQHRPRSDDDFESAKSHVSEVAPSFLVKASSQQPTTFS